MRQASAVVRPRLSSVFGGQRPGWEGGVSVVFSGIRGSARAFQGHRATFGEIAGLFKPSRPPLSSAQTPSPRRVSVAPMMDWTDRHCRSLHRVISRHTWLYTEMVTTGALLHGDVPRHLAFTPEEAPVALQLGGSEPDDLARSAKLGEQWGYEEINLNCGCPSERVQRRAFGACLMNEPQLVADCVKSMRDVVSVPVTVKHRICVDAVEDYAYVRDFVGTVADAGCERSEEHTSE